MVGDPSGETLSPPAVPLPPSLGLSKRLLDAVLWEPIFMYVNVCGYTISKLYIMYLASQEVTCISPSLANSPLQSSLNRCNLLGQVITCMKHISSLPADDIHSGVPCTQKSSNSFVSVLSADTMPCLHNIGWVWVCVEGLQYW